MAINQSTIPATGARGRRQFPDDFHHDAQEELMSGAAPVITRPFLPSSSPVRRSTSAVRNGNRKRRHLGKNANPNANYYGILADEEDEIADTFDTIDLESETRKIIAKEKERLTTRADVLRTFAESIAACARKFDHGYPHAVANDFTRSLLTHWNQFLHAGETVESTSGLPQPKLQPAQKHATKPPTDSQALRPRAVSFADVTKAATQQKPGDVRIAPTRRQPIATSNYTDRRILLRLKQGSSFFEKKSFQIRLALKDKLALHTQDIQDIKPTNTGWALLARNEEIQKKIIESQDIWGPVMDLDTAEKHVVWHTYMIENFPNEIPSYDGSILDFEKTISEEILAQTGQAPVQWRRSSKPSLDPTKTSLIISFEKAVHGNFRLLGAGSYSFRLTKAKRLAQCQNCWLFHPPVRCTATKTCRTCGITDQDHDVENCQATPKCTNCHGPHQADYEGCYARPKKVGNAFHKLSKSQRIHARKLGSEDYRRQNKESTSQSSSNAPAQNDEPAIADNAEEADTEMANTAPVVTHHNSTEPQQAEQPPLAGEDEEMGEAMQSIEKQQPQIDTHDTEADEEVVDRTEFQEEQHQANEDEEAADGAEESDEEAEDNRDDIEYSESDSDDANADADTGAGTDTESCHNDAEEETQQSPSTSSQANSAGSNAVSTNTEQQPQSSSNSQALSTHAPPGESADTIQHKAAQHMTTVKKRFLTTYSARKIIPSDDTTLSSDPPVRESIIARTSRDRSPPSSPPHEARGRAESPKKRRRNLRYSK